jgi:hypothetical protein
VIDDFLATAYMPTKEMSACKIKARPSALNSLSSRSSPFYIKGGVKLWSSYHVESITKLSLRSRLHVKGLLL